MRFTCLLLFFVASAAFADNAASVRFLILDLDGDGYVSLAEAAGIGDVVERFDRADADHDGRLSSSEFDRLDKLKTRTAATRRERVRAAVARDARAAEHAEATETANVDVVPSAAAGASAAAGGTFRRVSP
jgi:hypothetical protein